MGINVTEKVCEPRFAPRNHCLSITFPNLTAYWDFAVAFVTFV